VTDLLQQLLNLALTSALDYLQQITASPRQIVAHCAALAGVVFVTAAAFVRTMTPLRWMAVGSNVGLLVFGALHPSVPTLMVSGTLLPINLWRAVEMMRITRRVQRASSDADLAAIWLKPYMRPLRLRAGKVLFRKGDKADRLFLLTSGELELVEVGARLQPGRIFGEIALFSPEHVRTNTVRCVTRCVVLSIHETTVRQLYFQNPAFGFHLIELLAARLSTDVGRVERKLEESEQRQEEYISRANYGMPLMPAPGSAPASPGSAPPAPPPGG
jgi:CRP/FNR family transcriptional regulator, cyclic AMP receptor protein